MTAPAISITSADTAQQRRVAHEIIAPHIDLEPTAIPALTVDHMYDPVVLLASIGDGSPVGALLACRPQVAAGMAMLRGAAATSAVMELDLVAVDPAHRRLGVGTSLVQAAEGALREKGTRILFGGVTDPQTSDATAAFYQRLGFRVLTPGQALPPFRGQQWVMSGAAEPVFWFWKKLG